MHGGLTAIAIGEHGFPFGLAFLECLERLKLKGLQVLGLLPVVSRLANCDGLGLHRLERFHGVRLQ